VVVAERLKLPQDQVKRLGVPLVVQERVLEERERGAVGSRELAEEVVAPVEESFEHVEGATQLLTEPVDAALVGSLLAPLGIDLVGWALPDAVEPVEEDVDLGTAGRSAGKSDGSGMRSSR
jgi:hypothetical protein